MGEWVAVPHLEARAVPSPVFHLVLALVHGHVDALDGGSRHGRHLPAQLHLTTVHPRERSAQRHRAADVVEIGLRERRDLVRCDAIGPIEIMCI